MVFFRNYRHHLLLVLGFAGLGAGLLLWLLPGELRAIERQLFGFPDSDAAAHHARTLVLAGLCALPALASLAYLAGDTLDRYIARQFLGIFAICLTALFVIWLLSDLADKLTEFREAESMLSAIAGYYAARWPSVLMLLLPFSLLLALLYSLGKLSSQREMVAIIQSGRGIFRASLPLVFAGVFCTLFALGLNYHWAPAAEGRYDDVLASATGKPATEARNVLFRNAEDGRLWKIGAFPPDYEKGAPLANVEITTTTREHGILSRVSANLASWNPADRRWTFEDPVVGRFSPGAPPVFDRPDGPLVVDSWSETPWQLIKPGLIPAHLGIPDLNTWLNTTARHRGAADPAPYLTHWHYRWALPFSCLVTVLLAAPLAIHFSRRGPGGGIFLAVVLAALMMLVGNISLAFGEAGLVPAATAAWLPNAIFTLIGLYLFHRRIAGRPIYQFLRRAIPGTD